MTRRERRAAWREARKNMPGALRECRAAEGEAYMAACRAVVEGKTDSVMAYAETLIPDRLRRPRAPGEGTHLKRTQEWRAMWKGQVNG